MRVGLTPVVIFLFLFFSPVSASLHRRDYVSYYSGAQTALQGLVVDLETGEPVPGAELLVQMYPEYREMSGRTDEEGRFRFEIELPGEHTFRIQAFAPGYENGVKTGEIRQGETKEVMIGVRFDPLFLSLNPTSLASQPSSTRLENRSFRATRLVVAGYEERRIPSGWRWEEYAQIGTRTESRSLGPYAGNWIPTGRTHTIYGIGPLHTSLPSLPGGYRWTKVSGDWISATYREERNEVEVLRAEEWVVNPIYETRTVQTGTRTEYGPWTHSRSVTLGTGFINLPSNVWEGKEETVSSTEKKVYWVRSYPSQVPSGYLYNFTLYKRSWHWLPPGWGSWRVAEVGIEIFPFFKGYSFTEGGGITEGWKKEYSYSYTIYTTATRYDYGYYTYTRTATQVPVYSTQQVLVRYFATKHVPVYEWVQRSGENPPVGKVYWERIGTGVVFSTGEVENYYFGFKDPQVGWVTYLERVYTVIRVPVMKEENYTACMLVEVPASWSPVSSRVSLIPRNGYSGPVYLETSGDLPVSLERREISLSSPAFVRLTASPVSASQHSVTVKAHAVDLNGKRRAVTQASCTVDVVGGEKVVAVYLSPNDNAQRQSWVEGEAADIEIHLVPRLFIGGVYDGGWMGGPITQRYTVDPQRPRVTEKINGVTITYLNYLDPQMRERAREWALSLILLTRSLQINT